MALVIVGRIVPLDPADPDAVFKGRVFLDDRGTIERSRLGTEVRRRLQHRASRGCRTGSSCPG